MTETTTKIKVPATLTAVASVLTVPVRASKRGSVTSYPWADLTAVGMQFGVTNKTAKQLAGPLANANKAALVDKLDEAGNKVFKTSALTATDGTVTNVPTSETEKVPGKRFEAFDVDADMKKQIKGTPLEGSTAIVFRTL